MTLVVNILRALLNFAAGIVIARGLGPQDYGRFIFLVGVFVALRNLLDMGATQAFYSLLCRRARHGTFITRYAFWVFLQHLIPILAIGLVFPASWISAVWKNETRAMVLLGFVATMAQHQVWNFAVMTGEARRRTTLVQGLRLGLGLSHAGLAVGLWLSGLLDLWLVFGLILVEHLLATVLAFGLLARTEPEAARPEGPDRPRKELKEYFEFCRPLIPYTYVGFAYEFADRWLLQQFGGSVEQAYYGVGYQFAAVALLATASILRIFWKEVAEADEREDSETVRLLYTRSSRCLFFFAAATSGLLLPWSQEIISVVLGESFIGGAPALAIMLLYPIHQCLGQLCGTLLYATGRTREHVVIGMGFMLFSMAASWLLLAPSTGQIPGLSLGSVGLSIKMVGLQFLHVNVMMWVISKIRSWKYDWKFQIVGMSLLLGAGWVAREVTTLVLPSGAHLATVATLALLVHGVLVLTVLFACPWLVALERRDLFQAIETASRKLGIG